jgi:hypothetical protein
MEETQLQADQKFVGSPMSKDKVVQKYSKKGKFCGRVMSLFGICQGIKIHPDGTTSQKIRYIDDVRIAGINTVTIIPERVLLSPFEFVGKVTGEIYQSKVTGEIYPTRNGSPHRMPGGPRRRHQSVIPHGYRSNTTSYPPMDRIRSETQPLKDTRRGRPQENHNQEKGIQKNSYASGTGLCTTFWSFFIQILGLTSQ